MKKGTMLRFLTTYLCVLLPVMLIMLVVTRDYLSNMEAQTKNSLNYQVKQSAQVLTDYYAGIPSKCSSLFENTVLTSRYVLDDPQVCREAITLLLNIQNFNGYEERVLVYYGGKFMISSSGTISPKVYFRDVIGTTSSFVHAAVAVVASDESQILFLPASGGGSVLYHAVVGIDGYGRQRSVEIVTDVSSLEKILRSTLRSEHIVLQIQIGEQTLYFYNSEEDCSYISHTKADTILEGFAKVYKTAEVDAGGMHVGIWCDLDEQLQEYTHFRNISISLLCFGLLLSLAISVTFSYVRFANLKTLVYQIRHRESGVTRKKHWIGMEIDYIQTLFDGYITESKSGKQKISEYQRLLLRQVSMLLFYGSLRNPDEIEATLKACNIELNEEFYFVLAIKVEKQQQMEDLDRLLQGDIHSAAANDESIMFVLCEIPHTDADRVERRATMERLVSTLGSVHINCVQMAASQVYDEIGKVNFAFLETYNIIENTSDALPDIITWEDYILLDKNDEATVGITYINEFRDAINSGDAKTAVEILTELMDRTDHGEQRDKLRYSFEQLLIAELNNQEDSEDISVTNDISALEGKSWDEYKTGLFSVLQRYFDARDNAVSFQWVLEFVEDHFNEFNFSLEMVAEYVGCSKSKMSKMFRIQTGISYLEYVTNLRMNKAKELLEQSDLSIRDVFYQVGYIDPTNASKKFRSYFGVTPSVYRQQQNKAE